MWIRDKPITQTPAVFTLSCPWVLENIRVFRAFSTLCRWAKITKPNPQEKLVLLSLHTCTKLIGSDGRKVASNTCSGTCGCKGPTNKGFSTWTIRCGSFDCPSKMILVRKLFVQSKPLCNSLPLWRSHSRCVELTTAEHKLLSQLLYLQRNQPLKAGFYSLDKLRLFAESKSQSADFS